MNKKQLASVLLLGVAIITLWLIGNNHPSPSIPDQNESDVSAAGSYFLSDLAKRPPSWAGTYLASRVAQSRFDWARAETFLTETDHIKPNNITMDRRLMLLAMGGGDFDAALAHAKMLKNEQDPTGLTQLVLLLEPLRDGRFITAEEMINALPKTSLSNYALPLLRAWIAAASGKTDQELLSSANPYFYHQVLLADFLNRIDLVNDPLHLKAGQNQYSAVASERMADIFLRHKQYDMALGFYQLTRLLNPHAPNLARKEDAAKNKAIDVSNLGLTPPVTNATTGIALVFFDMATTFYNDQGYESAQLFARMALTLDPKLTEARLLLGNVFSRNNRLDAAIDIYQTIPDTEPRYRAVQQQIAALQVAMEQDDAAIATLQNLLTKTENRDEKVSIWLQIGDIHRENEVFEPALAAYDQAFDLLDGKVSADHWDLLYARGMTLERLKRWERAEKDLKTALAYQPDHPYLMNYLAYSWADQGLYLDQAMALLLKAVSIVPDDGYVTDSVGWVYYRMKKYTDAVAYMERAVELLPYDPTINDHLGDVYWQVGRKREAKFQWQRAFNYSKDDTQKIELKKKLEEGLAVGT